MRYFSHFHCGNSIMETEDKELPKCAMFTDSQDSQTSQVWHRGSCNISTFWDRDAHFSDLTYANLQRARKPTYLRSRSRLGKFSHEHPSPFKRRAKLTVPDPDLSDPKDQLTVPDSDSSDSKHQTTFTFEKREITTIQEEVFYYKGNCKRRPGSIYGCSKAKERKKKREKVASLKVVVGRLKKMCLTKPEVLQNKLPEEIMKLFSGIQI